MTIIGSDGYIYAAGFIGGDEAGTIFIVYAGQSVVMKIDPSDGSEIWTDINPNSEYSIALVESSDDYIYSAAAGWAEMCLCDGTGGLECAARRATGQ